MDYQDGGLGRSAWAWSSKEDGENTWHLETVSIFLHIVPRAPAPCLSVDTQGISIQWMRGWAAQRQGLQAQRLIALDSRGGGAAFTTTSWWWPWTTRGLRKQTWSEGERVAWLHSSNNLNTSRIPNVSKCYHHNKPHPPIPYHHSCLALAT